MKSGFTLINLIIALHILFYGLLLLIAKSDYWAFLDFLTQPLAEFVFIADENGEYGTPGVFTILTFQLFDTLKEFLLNVLIAINSYNLISSILIINAGLLILSAAYLFLDYENLFSQLSVGVLIILGFIFLLIDDEITRSDVDEAWKKYISRDVTEIDYYKYLLEGRYDTVSKIVSKVHELYLKGEIDELNYLSEFAKFNSGSDEYLPLINRWVDDTKHKDLALMARGCYYEELGWKSRGTKNSSKTSEAQFEGMRKYFKLAINDHRAALALNKKLLLSYRSLINMASAGEVDYDRKELYMEARELFPGSYALAYRYMFKLQPKWGGSYREMRELTKMERARAVNNPKIMALGGEELLFRGNKIHGEKKYNEAEKKYRQALLYSPREGYFMQLYYTFTNRKDYESAKSVLDDCLEFRPYNNFCLAQRAVTNINLNDGDAALADATVARNNEGLSKWNTNNLGWVYERISYYDKAVDMYERTLVKYPSDEFALKNLYKLSYQGHVSYDAVLHYFKQAVDIEPNNSQYWIWYADTLEDINRKGSVIAYKKYIELVDHNNENNKETIGHVKNLIAEIESE